MDVTALCAIDECNLLRTTRWITTLRLYASNLLSPLFSHGNYSNGSREIPQKSRGKNHIAWSLKKYENSISSVETHALAAVNLGATTINFALVFTLQNSLRKVAELSYLYSASLHDKACIINDLPSSPWRQTDLIFDDRTKLFVWLSLLQFFSPTVTRLLSASSGKIGRSVESGIGWAKLF